MWCFGLLGPVVQIKTKGSLLVKKEHSLSEGRKEEEEAGSQLKVSEMVQLFLKHKI